MTETETIQQVSKTLITGIEQLTKIAVCREQEADQLITRHYQDVVIANIDAKSKEISADKVIAWAQVPPEYFQLHKPRQRNSKRVNTFWGVDVLKYLCDLWQRDYPESYHHACYALRIDPKTGDLNPR
jgi:hypothetical protein